MIRWKNFLFINRIVKDFGNLINESMYNEKLLDINWESVIIEDS